MYVTFVNLFQLFKLFIAHQFELFCIFSGQLLCNLLLISEFQALVQVWIKVESSYIQISIDSYEGGIRTIARHFAIQEM